MLYKISEVAKIFNISRETLIYYDSINLLVPKKVDEVNGYRLYNDENVSDLYFILMMKNANFSLKEIKEYIECKNTSESIQLLNNKMTHIKEKMKLLKESYNFIEEKIEEIKKITSPEGCLPFFESLEETKVYLLEIEEPKREKELIEGIGKLNKFRKKHELNKVGRITILKQEDFVTGNYFRIHEIGVVNNISDELCNRNLSKTRCISIYHKDFTNKIGESYCKLLKFIEENNLEITGSSREFFNDVIVNAGNCMGQSIKISIPIKTKKS
ncbi:MerR family transcriptional regulator [uncultured Cetobacterium sp.]|uniref:MerR family transcriptional regulator n=1 Tax=uncultured Cetobacterium sp. TaxID=527638 RepID=UPI00260B25E6|nr:MerR family transcriptional regulator [uncultured Cetobacterium sp.]